MNDRGKQTGSPANWVRLCEDVPVVDEADICVLGGSCTGVFAAVRAARLGARVIIVERQNHFGGVAAATCTWHSLLDTVFEKQIIGGLTQEVIERLGQRDAVKAIERSASKGYEFRPGELKIVLDEMVAQDRITPYLHTLFSSPLMEDGHLRGVVIDNKSGRAIIKASVFVDATGDGDLCSRLGLSEYRYDTLLPPTTCAFLDQWPLTQDPNLGAEILKYGGEHGLEPGFVWGSVLPDTDICMLAGTRIRNVDCSNANDLTKAEIEGRRQVKAIMELVRARRPELKVRLHDFPSSIGIRDTRHISCQYQIQGADVLEGRRFDDAIANGSYRVDIHHQDKPGITLMYLDGRTQYGQPGMPTQYGRWREPGDDDPTFYQIPLRSLIPGRFGNLILAGRMLDADKTAFSAVRVMVNTNQMGEAAGVGAYIALTEGIPMEQVDPGEVRNLLAQDGSIII